MKTEISINGRSQTCIISNSVDSSQTASAFADYLENRPYLKVSERKYRYPQAIINCHTIKGIFSIEKLHEDIALFNETQNTYENE